MRSALWICVWIVGCADPTPVPVTAVRLPGPPVSAGPTAPPPTTPPPTTPPTATAVPVPASPMSVTPGPVLPPPPLPPAPPGTRDIHPLSPDMPSCIEMYSACSPDPANPSVQRCTSAPYMMSCGQIGQVPGGGDRLRCVCP